MWLLRRNRNQCNDLAITIVVCCAVYAPRCMAFVLDIKTMRVPLVVTSYNMHEAFEDEDTISEWGVDKDSWCWSPELNPFRSLEKRRGHSTCDNCYWQCVWKRPRADDVPPDADNTQNASETDNSAAGDSSKGPEAPAHDHSALRAVQQRQFPIDRALPMLKQRATELAATVRGNGCKMCLTTISVLKE